MVCEDEAMPLVFAYAHDSMCHRMAATSRSMLTGTGQGHSMSDGTDGTGARGKKENEHNRNTGIVCPSCAYLPTVTFDVADHRSIAIQLRPTVVRLAVLLARVVQHSRGVLNCTPGACNFTCFGRVTPCTPRILGA